MYALGDECKGWTRRRRKKWKKNVLEKEEGDYEKYPNNSSLIILKSLASCFHMYYGKKERRKRSRVYPCPNRDMGGL